MKKVLLPVNGYTISESDFEELDNRFTYHPPVVNQKVRYESLRAKFLGLAREIVASVPKSREEALALTNLEQSMFWANAAIARNEEKPGDFSTCSYSRVEKYRAKENE